MAAQQVQVGTLPRGRRQASPAGPARIEDTCLLRPGWVRRHSAPLGVHACHPGSCPATVPGTKVRNVGSGRGGEARDQLGWLFALVFLQEGPGAFDGGVRLPGGAGHLADEHGLAASGDRVRVAERAQERPLVAAQRVPGRSVRVVRRIVACQPCAGSSSRPPGRAGRGSAAGPVPGLSFGTGRGQPGLVGRPAGNARAAPRGHLLAEHGDDLAAEDFQLIQDRIQRQARVVDEEQLPLVVAEVLAERHGLVDHLLRVGLGRVGRDVADAEDAELHDARPLPAGQRPGRPASRRDAMLAAMTHPDTAAGPTRALGADFAVPITDRYFEDYQPGAVYEYGYLTVTEAEILDFARRFDPQPMHIDRDRAEAGPFGGLIASGWHTAGLFMRLYADHYLTRVASLASPGIDELRWPAPLRPGDLLRIRAEVAGARPSRSKPDRGLVRTRCELIASPDTTVMTRSEERRVGKGG